MGLKLNATGEGEKYKEFYGRNVDEMPKLIADGRVPMSFVDFERIRLEVKDSNDSELKSGWHDNYFDTGDGALCFSNGDLVVAYDAKALREMTPQTPRIGGALDLSELDLKDVSGEKFTKEQLEKMVLNKSLTLEQAKVHPLLVALARGDKKLAVDYAEMVFAETYERFSYDTNMGIYLDSTSDKPKMRAWFVSGMGGRSVAFGYFSLGNGNGRLVGIASN